MPQFFLPPNRAAAEQGAGGEPPRWVGRPHGEPPGVVLSEVTIAAGPRATVSVTYIDAYPEGIEVQLSGESIEPMPPELLRDGDGALPDLFGRHWPMEGEPHEVVPDQILRVAVEFPDGRLATNITGHSRPMAGPTLWPLSGGAAGRDGRLSFRQGYWIAPLPEVPAQGPAPAITLVVEWPAAGISLTRYRVDGQRLLDAVARSRGLIPCGTVTRDGRRWRMGTGAEIAWIEAGLRSGSANASSWPIPGGFPDLCVTEFPDGTRAPRSGDLPELAALEAAMIGVLADGTPEQPWWLGYLDTGGSDVLFPYADRVRLEEYGGWDYVLIEAGPDQALGWGRAAPNLWSPPDLIFPTDRSWLVAVTWDEDWINLGGSADLVNQVLAHPVLGPRSRRPAAREARRRVDL